MFKLFKKRRRGFEFVSTAHWVLAAGRSSTLKLPTRSDMGSAGYDIYNPTEVTIPAGQQVTIWTNVKAYMEKDEVLHIYLRSSVGIKRGLRLPNHVGVIDSTYYNNPDNDGNIAVCLENPTNEDIVIVSGERIAQGVFQKYLIADNDTVLNKQRLGGIGHSGRL